MSVYSVTHAIGSHRMQQIDFSSRIRNHLFEEIYNTCNLQKGTVFIVHIDVGSWLLEKVCLKETHIN